jgi:Domain of unknown function (DUF1707)
MTGEVSPADDSGQAGAIVPGELRASHADRDQVVEVLRVAAGDGRLTAEELDQRLETALTARTLSELAALTTDLPASPGYRPVAAPEAKDLVRIECGSGSAKRDGAWVVPRRMEVRVSSGAVRLDFSQAVITEPVLRLDADVTSGHLLLVTRPGVIVDADDVAINSGQVKVRAYQGPAVPTILRIEVSGKVRSGTLKARPPRPPRRTLLQWLLRRPRPSMPALPG